MKNLRCILAVTALSALVSARANVYVVNTVDNTDFSAGKTNMVTALKLLQDGDTINFAIPGAGVHTIATPPDGYPLITANNVTIDGYSQQQTGSMASPNTASIHETNNAQLMICLSSVNGNALSMYSAVTNFTGIDYQNFGFGDSEQAVLGFFRATNAWVKGIAFLAAPATATSQSPDPSQNTCKTICFACDALDVGPLHCQGWHVSGCWFGIDPTTRQIAYMPDNVTVATPGICIATYATGANTNGNINNYPGPATIGVAAGSPNPRAEFNVFLTGYGLDSQGGPFRVSGNFWNVLPDGTTLADISVLNQGGQQGDAYVEFGSGHDILIGTDGDGVNDADEGNVFGAYANGGRDIYYYGSQANTIIAGNTFGMDIHGNSFNVGQQTTLVHHFNNGSYVRFGSDFNGVSDALEGNSVVDSLLFDVDSGSTTNAHWISFRGNSLVNCSTPDTSIVPIGDGQTSGDGLDLYANFIDVGTNQQNSAIIIPVISNATSSAFLVGSCGHPVSGPYTKLVVDLYVADPTSGILQEGKKWLASFKDNSGEDLDPNVGSFKFALPAGLAPSGTKVTITVSYTSTTPPTIALTQRASNLTTLAVTNANTLLTNMTPPVYGIWQASNVAGPYSLLTAQSGLSTAFTDTSATSFYTASGGAANGPTSPFSVVYTMP